jgi:hypothetical protein
MNTINVQWSVEQIEAWFNENPSLSWGEVWESLSECFDGETINKKDRVKIKQALSMRDIY